ncbi:BapA/Bap/LapF family prefix-like domain-containing protein, partial [Stenoxybacter acetivorans]|uniref:BapA/Bap/LapF family prefix-like domain-containing protein n=1 Tax=Stenoxybacter acetivorans TaxID=422441 RepID=UPI000565A27F
MAHIDIISRASKKVLSAVEGVRADITHLSPNGDAVVVKLNIGNDTIVDIKQEGSQLLVVLSNGEVIIIDGYFSQMCESESTRGRGEAAGDNTNHLAVEDAVGNLYFISTVSKNQCLAEVQYYSIESIDPLLSQTEVDVAGWKPWFGYGSVITAAVIGLSQGDNGKSSPPSAPAPTIRIDSPVFRDKNGNDVTKGTDIANGKIAASVHIFGHVDNIADGTKIRVTISPKDLARLGLDSKASTVVCETVVQNGKWELHLDINGKEIDVGMFRQGLDTMQIVAMALNDNGKVLAEHKKSAGLITRLPANGLDVPDYEMTVPANPHDPLNGKGTPGHKITVTFPDGNTATATVDKNGNWSVENPGNLPNGSHVVVNQTNPSGEIGQINGQDPIVGKGDAGNIIIVKMPDGSTSSVVVDKNGNWRIPNPGNFKDGDKISIIAEDDYGNSTTKEAKVPDATAPDVPHV